MLRVEIQHAPTVVVVKLEGRLTGEYALHTRTLTLMKDNEPRKDIVVDLTEVTFVDAEGEKVLSCLGRLGAEFIADEIYPRFVCERLSLPLAFVALEDLIGESRP